MQTMYAFLFHYPLLMAFVQIFGSLVYHFVREKNSDQIDKLEAHPFVSILIPCRNEEDCIEETIRHLDTLDYPAYEIIAVNDASTDRTLEILRRLQKKNPRLRILNMSSNQGKGMGLTMATVISKGEYLICIDADALLDSKAVKHMVWHFLSSPRVGAVTGNPRVRNRSSLVGKIQVGEFSSIVGMIKRTQRILGKIFTVSGVIAGFRKYAIVKSGYWSNDMVTEDIDISWKLQTRFWDIRYEPRALVWILMPETLKGLWKQRLRWSQGGSEVMKKFFFDMFSWNQRRIWLLYIEYSCSIVWSYCFALTLLIYLVGLWTPLPEGWAIKSIIPGWTGVILCMTCLLQMGIGLAIETRFEPKIYRMFFWLIWYPLIYWVLNAMVAIVGFPKAMFKPKGTRAVWVSPDRGI